LHELQVTERILEVALQHAAEHRVSRIVVIYLRVGELSHLEEDALQRYFGYLSRGTLAEDAKLEIEPAPIVLACDACSFSYQVSKAELNNAACPECGDSGWELVSGREYFVKNMGVI